MPDLTASATAQLPVFDVLGRSSARRERELVLADGLRLVQWCNHGGSMDYQRPGHHTLSVYLQGGHDTHLIETPRETGHPGCHCVLPAEHESRWNVAGPLRFVHLYLSAGIWADRARGLLRGTALPLADIAAACGHAGASHLSRHVKAATGATPGQFRQALGTR